VAENTYVKATLCRRVTLHLSDDASPTAPRKLSGDRTVVTRVFCAAGAAKPRGGCYYARSCDCVMHQELEADDAGPPQPPRAAVLSADSLRYIACQTRPDHQHVPRRAMMRQAWVTCTARAAARRGPSQLRKRDLNPWPPKVTTVHAVHCARTRADVAAVSLRPNPPAARAARPQQRARSGSCKLTSSPPHRPAASHSAISGGVRV